MLSFTYLTVTAYNNLPLIETQTLPDEATLRGLGNLIVQFGVEHLVGIYLIHKHFDLTQDTIMVHNGLAFEYGDEEHLNLTDSFLRAFADYLEAHMVSSRIALSKANASNKFFMEYCQPATMSQIWEEVNGNEISPAEATEWIFRRDTLSSGSAVPIIYRGCKRTSSDDHKHYD
ncbi:MAG: hypothetical protein ASARMPRED_005889 [Alectoria sarmentosa]|nr:MAG: hypothetical protein ASARMPRED_005889 [Alectoria sarmentosa]